MARALHKRFIYQPWFRIFEQDDILAANMVKRRATK